MYNQSYSRYLKIITINSIFFFFKSFGFCLSSEMLTMRMRVQAFENALRQPIFWFDMKNSLPSNIVTTLARDAPLVKSVSTNTNTYSTYQYAVVGFEKKKM